MGLFMRACSHPVLCFYALLSRQLELHKEVGKEDTEKRPPLQPPCMPRFQSRVTVTRELDYNVDWLRYSFKTLLIVAVTVIHTSCEINIKLEQKQFRLETGFEPMTSAIPDWAIEPTRSWSPLSAKWNTFHIHLRYSYSKPLIGLYSNHAWTEVFW